MLRLQKTTIKTRSRSKYNPIIPRLIFKASLFSLGSGICGGRREMRKAFKSSVPWVVGWCLEIFHILFTPGRFQPGNRRELAEPPPGHSSSLSLFYLLCHPRLKISVYTRFPTAFFQSTPPDLKQTCLAVCGRRRINVRGGIKILIKGTLLLSSTCGPNHTTPLLISK